MIRDDRKYIEITPEPLDPGRLRSLVVGTDCGAIITFDGIVRDNVNGREVNAVEYQAYPEMAEKVLSDIADEALERWPVGRITVQHRLGTLKLSESSVLILVSSPHRPAAFEVSRFIIEEIKVKLPVWKREHFPDGTSEWQLPASLTDASKP